MDSLLTGAGAMTITRNAQNGFMTGAVLGAVSTSYGYNTFGEMTSQTNGTTGSTLYNAQYVRDKLGRITQKAETVNGVSATYAYVYDVAGRLAQTSKDGAVISAYAYDSNGNRIGKTDSIGTVGATYDDQDRLLVYGMGTYTYTANGELTGKNNPSGMTSYQYDALGNLLSVALPDGRLIEYVVDGANRRVGKKVGGVPVQGFLYANQLNPIAELDGAGNVVSTFVYGTKGNVPDYMVKGGNTYRIISDHLGSPRVVVNSATGIVAQVMDFDEFGNVIADSNPGFQPFGFVGGLYDIDTKLTRFGARDYDAETGRWTNKEPLGFAGAGTNFYDYALGDPINIVDIDGLQINWNGMVVNNPSVRTNLEQVNQNIVDAGASNDSFTITVTGGDRYRDNDGNVRSSTNNQMIPNSAKDSAHLVENGARAIDIRINGIDKDAAKNALINTQFDPKKTKDDYPDHHVHLEIPSQSPPPVKKRCP